MYQTQLHGFVNTWSNHSESFLRPTSNRLNKSKQTSMRLRSDGDLEVIGLRIWRIYYWIYWIKNRILENILLKKCKLGCYIYRRHQSDFNNIRTSLQNATFGWGCVTSPSPQKQILEIPIGRAIKGIGRAISWSC